MQESVCTEISTLHACVCVSVYQDTAGWWRAKAKTLVNVREWKPARCPWEESESFFNALFKKGYDSAIQIPRLAAKPLVTHTTYTHKHFCENTPPHTPSIHERIHFISKENSKLKTKTNVEATKRTECDCRSLRVRKITASQYGWKDNRFHDKPW